MPSASETIDERHSSNPGGRRQGSLVSEVRPRHGSRSRHGGDPWSDEQDRSDREPRTGCRIGPDVAFAAD